jgi:hypothetical protein
MILGIHQPNFLPWLGYFYKMARSDHFIFLDTVPFTKGGYTNRVKTKSAAGAKWLTVPVLTKGKLGQPIMEVPCNTESNWQKKTLASLEANYRKCPHYSLYGPEIVQIISAAGENLAATNIELIQYMARQLGISTPTTRSSEMHVEGKATDLLISLCRKLNADVYLSGAGGVKYQEEEAFRADGIDVRYSDFEHPVYAQQFGEFTPGLSIVDLLFNCGPESASVLGI